jgi:hypothetical protein
MPYAPADLYAWPFYLVARDTRLTIARFLTLLCLMLHSVFLTNRTPNEIDGDWNSAELGRLAMSVDRNRETQHDDLTTTGRNHEEWA